MAYKEDHEVIYIYIYIYMPQGYCFSLISKFICLILLVVFSNKFTKVIISKFYIFTMSSIY